MSLRTCNLFPGSVPLHSATAPKIMAKLLKWIAWVGIPKEILIYQGMNFITGVMKGVCDILQMKHLRISVYHPQTDGLMKHFNHTLNLR